jgi:hypothetical protein
MERRKSQAKILAFWLRPSAARLWKTFRSKPNTIPVDGRKCSPSTGTVFAFTTECCSDSQRIWCSPSQRNRVRFRPDSQLSDNFVEALFECLLEAVELIPLGCPSFIAALCVVGVMVYQLMFDPNAVDVASRLDTLSLNPNKWIPRSWIGVAQAGLGLSPGSATFQTRP